MPSAQNMAVQMRDGFTAISTVVNHQPVPAWFQSQPIRHHRRLEQQMSEQLVVLGHGLGYARHRFFGKNQNMRWRLRMEIANRHYRVVFKHNLRGDFPCHNLFKQGFAHGIFWREGQFIQ